MSEDEQAGRWETTPQELKADVSALRLVLSEAYEWINIRAYASPESAEAMLSRIRHVLTTTQPGE